MLWDFDKSILRLYKSLCSPLSALTHPHQWPPTLPAPILELTQFGVRFHLLVLFLFFRFRFPLLPSAGPFPKFPLSIKAAGGCPSGATCSLRMRYRRRNRTLGLGLPSTSPSPTKCLLLTPPGPLPMVCRTASSGLRLISRTSFGRDN